MIWGIVTLLFAFFLGPLARKTIPRLGLAGIYVFASLFFLNALLEMESPLYYHFVPQTLALFDLSFAVDILSLLFCLLVTFIGAIIMAYSAYYIEEEDGPRFSTLINFFTLSMIGLVLSHNLLGLFIFWEFTSICSYFLISFDGSNETARRAAWQSLVVNAIGGLCLLCGLLILGGIGGSYDLLQIRMPQDHPWLGTAIILIIVGVLTKSAQFPFHFWLPNAMTAPSPASAYLHSATMVKAGIFLLLRLTPYISNHPYWNQILVPVGIISALLASFLLLFDKDLKRILAYTTIASLGIMVYLIGRNDAVGFYLATIWLIAHAFYKAPLFLLAGNIEHYSGSRDVTVLSQLYPRMKGSLLVAILGSFSLLAIPPVMSFHAKGEFFHLLGKSPLHFWMLIFVFSAAGSVAFTLLSIFIRGNREKEVEGRFFNDEDDPALLWLPPAAAFVISFMIGIRYFPFTQFLKLNLGQVLPLDFENVGIESPDKKLALIASATVVFFAIFFAAIASGLRKSSFGTLRAGKFRFDLGKLSGDSIWDKAFSSLMKFSEFIYKTFQNNRIEFYTITSFVFLIFLFFWQFVSGVEFAAPIIPPKFILNPFENILIAALIVACALAVQAETNLAALVTLGVIGYGIAYIYLVNAAPDLAITQFLVESLSLVLVVVTFKYLPKTPYRVLNRGWKIIFLSVSIAMGAVAGVLTFFASSTPRLQNISRYIGEKTLTLAHGKNAVNTTIVDFRGFDTLGEITVLTLAAVGVVSLLKRNVDRRVSSK